MSRSHSFRLAVAATATALALLVVAPALIPGSAPGAARKSADRLIFWLGCDKLAGATDAELDAWKARGVDGFVCMAGRLRGLGGTQALVGNPTKALTGHRFSLQRALRGSRITRRAKARGMKMYLGLKLSNYYNIATPLRDWFDDAGWSNGVLPKVRDLAAAARLLGFAGIAFDQELYPQQGGAETATWDWNYPGNTHSEAAVRAKARQRGRELMSAIVTAFPGAELMSYDVQLPESWAELVQREVNGADNAYAANLDIDFWDGLLSVNGYGAIRLMDAIFYKTPHKGTWDNALQYNANRLASLFSRRLSNWEYASSRLSVSPFSWIDPGPSSSSFDDARSPDYVREQLLAFRKWGMGGEFANYVYGDLHSFDYSPYVSAMQEASTPAAVDPVDPTLTADTPSGSAAAPSTIHGTAHDNLAVWAVRWSDDAGGSGVARLDWQILSGNHDSEYVWQTQWSVPASALSPGATRVTITAEDIKGNTSAPATVSWSDAGGGGGSSPPGSSAPPPGSSDQPPGSGSPGPGSDAPGPGSPGSDAPGGNSGSPGSDSPTPGAPSSDPPSGGGVRGSDGALHSRPPRTRITHGPRGRSRDRTPRFRFAANRPTRKFTCKIDRRPWRHCNGKTIRFRLKPGRHVFSVRATDRAGKADPTPARRWFRIVRR